MTDIRKNRVFLILCYISSLIIGAFAAGIFVASWIVISATLMPFIIFSIIILLISIITYFSFNNFKINSKYLLLSTISISLIISIISYLTKTQLIKYINKQATAISQISDPQLANSASQAVARLLAIFNNPINLLAVIAIIIITYNLLPIIFIRKYN